MLDWNKATREEVLLINRIVKHFSSLYVLVRHGGGDERFRLHDTQLLRETMAAMDTNTRYFLLHALYYASNDGAKQARESERKRWAMAACEKRIKTKKLRGSNSVKVWIEDAESVRI